MSASSNEEAQIAEFDAGLHADVLLRLSRGDKLRFIRARKGVIADAVAMANNWGAWWQEKLPEQAYSPETILEAEDPNEPMHIEFCPVSHTGNDKDGCPIYWERSGYISGFFSQVADKLQTAGMVARHIRTQEMLMCRLWHNSRRFNKPIEKIVIVFDLKDMVYSLDTRALSTFQKFIACDERYYPERLKHFFVINAPWFFTAVWAVVRPWIDPVTREKFQILGSDYMATLSKYIDMDQIPSLMGGAQTETCWTYPYPEESGCSPAQVAEFVAYRRTVISGCAPTSAASASASASAVSSAYVAASAEAHTEFSISSSHTEELELSRGVAQLEVTDTLTVTATNVSAEGEEVDTTIASASRTVDLESS